MPIPSRPFRSERIAIGLTRDGRPLELVVIGRAMLPTWLPRLRASAPRPHHAYRPKKLTAFLAGQIDMANRFVIGCGGTRAGARISVPAVLDGQRGDPFAGQP